jgi:hypothetical protein
VTAAVENPQSTRLRSPSLVALDLTVATVRPAFRAAQAVGQRLPTPPRPLTWALRSRPVVAIARTGRPYRVALLQDVDARLAAVLTSVVEQVLRRVDLAALIERHVDLDRLVAGVDLDAVVARMDLAALAEDVIATLDVPEIIRESTSAVSSEAVREVRMRGIAADDLVSRAVQRFGARRPRAHPSLAAPDGSGT